MASSTTKRYDELSWHKTHDGSVSHASASSSSTAHQQLRVLDMDSANLLRHFPWTCEFLEEGSQGSNRVLVHCQAGVSRSVTVLTVVVVVCIC